MNHRLRHCIAALLVMGSVYLAPARALADTYFVAVTGSDSAAGTESDPFATIQRAAEAAQPGDEVVVRSGSYAGFAPPRGGTETARITYRADGSVVIDRPCSRCDGSGVNLRDDEAPRNYVTIEGFEIRGLDRHGVALSWTTGTIVRGCTVIGNGAVGIYGGHTTDALIEGNESADNSSHGVYIANSSVRPTIRGNYLHDNGSAGIHFNGDVRYPPGDGIIHGAVIDGNRIIGNASNGINWDGVQDSVVSNNFIADNEGNGIRAFGPPNSSSDAAEGPRNDLFVNNTILAREGRWCIRITDDHGDNVAFNNILLAERARGGSIALDATRGFASGYNLVEGRLTLDRGDTILSLSEWQAQGYGEGSAVADATELFETAGDPHLAPGAGAIDQGVASFSGRDAPGTDIDGQARPAGAGFDIGADEEGAVPATDAGVPMDDGGVGLVDAGPRPGADASASLDAGRPDDRDAGSAGSGDSGGGGCGCRASGAESGANVLLLALLFGLTRRRGF